MKILSEQGTLSSLITMECSRMHQTLIGRRNSCIFLVLGLCLIAAVAMSTRAQAQERSSIALSSIPAEWPDDPPPPTGLSNIGGWFNTEVYPEGAQFSIDIWGAYDGSGTDYLAAYHEVLMTAGFELVDRHEGSDVTNARYQRGVERLTIGTDIISEGAPSEYTEIGVVYYWSILAEQ